MWQNPASKTICLLWAMHLWRLLDTAQCGTQLSQSKCTINGLQFWGGKSGIPPIFQKEEHSLKGRFLYNNTSRHPKSWHQNPLVLLDYSSQLFISSIKLGLLTLLGCRLASYNSINPTSFWNAQNTTFFSSFTHLEIDHLWVFFF